MYTCGPVFLYANMPTSAKRARVIPIQSSLVSNSEYTHTPTAWNMNNRNMAPRSGRHRFRNKASTTEVSAACKKSDCRPVSSASL